MKLLLALLFLVLPAIADTSICAGTLTNGAGTISCTSAAASCTPPQPPPFTQPCTGGQTGTITTSFSCVGSTWTATTTNGCTTPPPPIGNVQIVSAPPVGGSPPIFTAQPKQIYAWGLPIAHGSVSISIAPGSQDFNIKVWLSKVPGDIATAQTMPLVVTQGFGVPPNRTVYPYYAYQGSESAGIGWTSVDDGRGTPVVGTGWYFNYQSQATVPVSFYMQIPQQ